MMEKEKNSQIEAGELSDDDLGSVAGGMERIIMGKVVGTIDWQNCSDMEITYKNGKYQFYFPKTNTRFEAVDDPEFYLSQAKAQCKAIDK